MCNVVLTADPTGPALVFNTQPCKARPRRVTYRPFPPIGEPSERWSQHSPEKPASLWGNASRNLGADPDHRGGVSPSFMWAQVVHFLGLNQHHFVLIIILIRILFRVRFWLV